MSGRCFCHYFCMLPHRCIARLDMGMILVEGYVHGNSKIWLGSLE